MSQVSCPPVREVVQSLRVSRIGSSGAAGAAIGRRRVHESTELGARSRARGGRNTGRRMQPHSVQLGSKRQRSARHQYVEHSDPNSDTSRRHRLVRRLHRRLWTCRIRAGKLECWGYDNHGELGHGSVTTRSKPTTVDTATDWESVDAAIRTPAACVATVRSGAGDSTTSANWATARPTIAQRRRASECRTGGPQLRPAIGTPADCEAPASCGAGAAAARWATEPPRTAWCRPRRKQHRVGHHCQRREPLMRDPRRSALVLGVQRPRPARRRHHY